MKINQICQSLFLLCLIWACSACKPAAMAIYGLKAPKELDKKAIERYAKRYRIPIEDCYELTDKYVYHLLSLDSPQYALAQKNHYQPMQALYYNQDGDLASWHINCYAGGFPNLKWNRNGIMNSFPPATQAPLDSVIPLASQLQYLRPLTQNNKLEAESYDYVVVVHWNRFGGRQSKRLVRQVQRNVRLASDKKVKIIYANNDNNFLH